MVHTADGRTDEQSVGRTVLSEPTGLATPAVTAECLQTTGVHPLGSAADDSPAGRSEPLESGQWTLRSSSVSMSSIGSWFPKSGVGPSSGVAHTAAFASTCWIASSW